VHDEWPAPNPKALTVFFDPDNKQSGFVSVNSRSENIRPVLNVVALEIWAALLLRSAIERVQKATASENELARATLRGRDEERRHIARELHDDLGQSLASLKLELKWVEDQIRDGRRKEEAVEGLVQAREEVGVLLEKTRDLSHTLYPRILDTLGLAAAIKELARQIGRFSRIHVECTTQGKLRRLDRETEIALYRCCQEAINNAIRHSGATRLIIRVCFLQKEVRVRVEDNGKGFDPRTLYDSNSRMMSSGFWTIRQRMADISAAFLVSTSEGQGTVVELIVPYSLRKSDGKNKTTDRR
jgi:signal transduction histidine kinase